MWLRVNKPHFVLSISDNWQFHYRTDTRLHIYKRVEHTYLMFKQFYIVEIVSGQERKRERGSEPEKKADLFSIALKVQIPSKQRHWFSNSMLFNFVYCCAILGHAYWFFWAIWFNNPYTIHASHFFYRLQSMEKPSKNLLLKRRRNEVHVSICIVR